MLDRSDQGGITAEHPSRVGMAAGVRSMDLPGGLTGYGMTRRDDCFRAATATALQVPIDDVPDPRIDEWLTVGVSPAAISRAAWQELAAWLDGRGLQLAVHVTVPVARDRWIGVCSGDQIPGVGHAGHDTVPFGDHCLVMSHDRILFDPGISLQPPPGMRLAAWLPSQVSYGLTFDHQE